MSNKDVFAEKGSGECVYTKAQVEMMLKIGEIEVKQDNMSTKIDSIEIKQDDFSNAISKLSITIEKMSNELETNNVLVIGEVKTVKAKANEAYDIATSVKESISVRESQIEGALFTADKIKRIIYWIIPVIAGIYTVFKNI